MYCLVADVTACLFMVIICVGSAFAASQDPLAESHTVSREESKVEQLSRDYLFSEDLEVRRLAAIALGVHYVESDYRLALQYLFYAKASSKSGDKLLPIIGYYEAKAKFHGGAYKDAIEIAKGLQRRSLGKKWQHLVYSILMKSHYHAGDFVGVAAVWKRYSKRYSSSRRKENIVKLAVLAKLQEGPSKELFELLEDLARNYPVTENSRWAFRLLIEYNCWKPASDANEMEQYVYSRKFLLRLSRNASLDMGIKEFIAGAVDVPMRVSRDEVRVLTEAEKVEFLIRAKQYPKAHAHANRLYADIKDQPQNEDLPTLVMNMGRISARLNEPLVASRYFTKYLADFPRKKEREKVREWLAYAYNDLGYFKAAADQFAELNRGKAKSKALRWHYFWNSYLAQDFPKALELLQRGRVPSRDKRERAFSDYWTARVLEKMGRETDAERFYQKVMTNRAGGFYSHYIEAKSPEFAVNKVKAKTRTKQRASSSGLAAKILGGKSQELTSPRRSELKAVDDLMKVGLNDVARIQISSLSWSDFKKEEESFVAASQMALSLKDFRSTSRRIRHRPFSALKKTPRSYWELIKHQQNYSGEWKIYFPLAFEEYVTGASKEFEVDRYLLLSVMRAESHYDLFARSWVGAQGLMQIMPYTAIKIARIIGAEEFSVEDLEKPEINIGFAGYYMQKLLKYYDDNTYLAVAAYNAGPQAVNRWLGDCQSCELDEFIESIPYTETRRYVKEVMTYFGFYSRIYEGKPPLVILPSLPEKLPLDTEIF